MIRSHNQKPPIIPHQRPRPPPQPPLNNPLRKPNPNLSQLPQPSPNPFQQHPTPTSPNPSRTSYRSVITGTTNKPRIPDLTSCASTRGNISSRMHRHLVDRTYSRSPTDRTYGSVVHVRVLHTGTLTHPGIRAGPVQRLRLVPI
ncbi:hypothetical protein GCM10009630_41560 [Kribbella jejuensis]|uniref:Uncharacterized protein n=1 Tax=Kribbella jejuensis TaxID=236068 RepID=A0A542E927_9ACTN|nr:hypothetical protein FB475_4719 [Kribbella jejuensis]